MPWFRVKGSVRIFEAVVLPALRDYRPQALSGPVPALRELAQAVLRGAITLPGLDHGVITLTGAGHPTLQARDRDMFWLAFQVPVFEQFRSWSGELLAWECEAHQGLHVENNRLRSHVARTGASNLLVNCANGSGKIARLLPTGLEAEVVDEPCPCGRPGPRLVGLRYCAEPLVRAYGASA